MAAEELAKLEELYSFNFIQDSEYERRKLEIFQRYGMEMPNSNSSPAPELTDPFNNYNSSANNPYEPNPLHNSYDIPSSTNYNNSFNNYGSAYTNYEPLHNPYDIPIEQPILNNSYDIPSSTNYNNSFNNHGSAYTNYEPPHNPYDIPSFINYSNYFNNYSSSVNTNFQSSTDSIYSTSNNHISPNSNLTTPSSEPLSRIKEKPPIKIEFDVSRIKRIPPKEESNELGLHDKYSTNFSKDSVVVYWKERNGVYETQPLQQPTLQQILDIFGVKHGFICNSNTRMKFEDKDQVIPPGQYLFYIKSGVEREHHFNPLTCAISSQLTQKNPNFRINRKAYPDPGCFSPLFCFTGVPSSDSFHPSKPSVITLKAKQFSETRYSTLHLIIRLRLIAEKYGMSLDQYRSKLLNYSKLCFVCNKPTINSKLFCKEHDDESANLLFSKINNKEETFASLPPVREKKDDGVLLLHIGGKLQEFKREVEPESRAFSYLENNPQVKKRASHLIQNLVNNLLKK